MAITKPLALPKETPVSKVSYPPELPLSLTRAFSAVRGRVLAVLKDWPSRHGYTREERDRLVQQYSMRLIEAWGGRLRNPKNFDLQALGIECEFGHVWRTGSAKLKRGLWCPQCAHEHRRSGMGAMQELARKHGGCCLSERYLDIRDALRWQCSHGHEWEMSAASVRAGNWCSACLDEERRGSWLPKMKALARRRGGICLSEAYVDSRTKLNWQCRQGHQWNATPATVRIAGAWCPVCAHERQRLTLGDLRNLAAEYGGKCLSDEYMGVTAKHRWRCAQGHEWVTSPARVRNGAWCASCSKQGRHDARLEQMRGIAVKRGGECLSDKYESTQKVLRWRCKLGHIWSAAPGNIRRGAWCPKCARAGRVKYSIDEMRAIATERGGRCLSKHYVNRSTKLEWLCELGHAWHTSPMSILAGTWCPACKYLNQCVTNEARRKYLSAGKWDTR